jgi:hypothetical protein
VILAGLLLGGALAHFFGGQKRIRQTTPTAIAAQSPAATPARILVSPSVATPAPTESPSSTPLPTGKPTTRPTPSRTAKPLRATAIVAPAHKPSPKASPALSNAALATSPSAHKPVAAMPAAASTAASVAGADPAAALVRSYLQALARGDLATATSYLAHGTPSETFMNSGSHIESIRSASVGAQRYQVTADVQNANGEYYVTCTVEPGPAGLQITEHYWIKPQ